MNQKISHCSFCGQPFAADQAWPRTCAACHNITFLNPTPVAVMLVPVDNGLLLIRRGIEPNKGKLALPGGFVDLGESWQAAGAREVLEETGIQIDPSLIHIFAVHSTPNNASILIFGLAAPMLAASLPPFTVTNETTERVIITAPTELAFPLHTQVMREFFAQHSVTL